MKKLYLFSLCSLMLIAAKAQINYSFAASSGTYTPISGTTVTLTPTNYDGGAGGLDEGYANAIPIGFNFTYNGAASPFTTVGVTSNGFMYLGSTNFSATSAFYTNNLSSGFASQRPIIAPLWDDELVGSIQYNTTGSAPNRVFTAQWSNVNWDYSATAPAVSFQVKLYETTNVIEFIYSNLGGAVTSGSASIGVTGTGTGSGNFLSLNNSTAAPTASNTTETTTINTAPATGQKYTFTPVVQPANDIAVDIVYALGKMGKGTMATVKAYVKNLGTSAGTNVPVTLTVTGANSYTTSVNVASFPSGAAGFVTFPAFPLTNTGTNTITVTVPNDNVNANNSASTTQDVTTNELNYAVGSTITSGINAPAAGDEVAVKLAVPYGNTITQVNAYFNSAGNAYDLKIYNNVAGLPGTAIYTQTGLTTTLGLNTINLSPAANVTDTFYVAFKMTGTNLAMGYQTESPLRPNAFFLKAGASPWFDLSGNAANTFRLMAGVTTGSPLPVTLTEFRGERRNTANMLLWATATETNNKGFELQRSADGANFSTIGTINSKAENGNSTSALNYSFTDERPFAGTNYYRLKQMDKDGKVTYSAVVILKGDKNNLQVSAVYPNPVKDQLNLSIVSPASEKASITVTDVTGKVVMLLNKTLVSGDNNLNINVSTLSTGSYYIRLVAGDETKTTQFIKH